MTAWSEPDGWDLWNDEPAGPSVDAFTTYSLARLIRDGVPEPVLLPGSLLYEGAIHVISGEPDSGKTTLSLWLMLQVLRAGRPVMMLDEEGGAEMTADKLIALGATEDDAQSLHYIPFPARMWNAADVAGLRFTATSVIPAMILIDSAAAFLARAGLDENAAADVTRFWQNVLVPLAREHGSAVVVIDHDGKNAGGRYSRGSGAKLAASDVMVKVTMIEPFSREANGVLRLTVTKDRRGYLHRHWDVQVRTGHGLRLVITEGTADDEPVKPDDLTPAQKKLLSVLTDEPATKRELVDRVVARYGHGLTEKTVRTAMNRMITGGIVDQICGEPGRPDFWLLRDPGNRITGPVTTGPVPVTPLQGGYRGTGPSLFRPTERTA